MGSLYDIAVMILGELPSQYCFIYYIFTFAMGLGILFCAFSPFLLAYKIIGRD